MQTTELVLKILDTVAIIAGSTIAIIGVNAWKRQLKGRTDYELARRYLRCVYKVRDSIRDARNPFIPVEETVFALEKQGKDKLAVTDRNTSDRAVYSLRWEKVRTAMSDLDVELLEAEVSWGRRAKEVTNEMNLLVKKLFVTIKLFLEDRHLPPERDIIYDYGEQDSFTKSINLEIEKIESFLKPHLK